MGLEENYERLMHAIVKQAVKDWRYSLKRLQKKPGNKSALAMKEETERFFLSEWFYGLSGVSGSSVLRKLQQEEIQ